MTLPFQVSEVVRPVRVDARRAIAISYKLQRRAPKRVSASARKCLEQLHARTEALIAARRARGAAPAPVDNREVMRSLLNAWGALRGRLVALAKLDAREVPEAAEALALLAAIFPPGRAIMKADQESLWVDSRDALDAIDQGGHEEKVNRLAGDFVLKAVRKAHRAAGVALGLTNATAPAGDAGVDLRPLLDAVTESIAAYALQLVAGTDADDPEAVRDVAHALDPIVQHRKRAKGRRGESVDEGSDGEQPVTHEDAPVPVDAPAANDSPAQKGRRVA